MSLFQKWTIGISVKIRTVCLVLTVRRNSKSPLSTSQLFFPRITLQLTSDIPLNVCLSKTNTSRSSRPILYAEACIPPPPFALSPLPYSRIANPNLIYGIFSR